MMAGDDEAGGLARGVVGSARTIAFGTSIVAPSASAATVLVLVVAYAGFASPLVVLITFAGSLCCALSIGQFAGRCRRPAGPTRTTAAAWVRPRVS